jgi:acetyl-CoA carboxylase biotin carboxyl carrier protein
MDIRKIRKLIQIMKETGLAEIEIKSGDESVRLSQQSNVGHLPTAQTSQHILPTNTPATPKQLSDKETSETEQKFPGTPVKSPMVGSVYLAKSPGEKPFVEVGQRVKEGDTLCLIEAMKMYNQIEAPMSGVISARLVENEQPVEYDQILFFIDQNA